MALSFWQVSTVPETRATEWRELARARRIAMTYPRSVVQSAPQGLIWSTSIRKSGDRPYRMAPTSVSALLAITSGTIYSSLRSLLPP
jgi:hypothetical protein